MKLVAVLLHLLLFASAGLAAEKSLPRSAGDSSCLPAGSERRIFAVKANWEDHKLPLKLRLLGFSRTGRLALLEQREGEEVKGLWFLRVVDLDNDRVLVERELETKAKTTKAFCRAHGAAIRGILTRYGIEPSTLPTLRSFPLLVDGGKVSLELRRRGKIENITRHEVWLKSDKGAKKLGTLREAHVESGLDPVGPPTVVGALRSPWEPRLAVLIRQDMVGIEGVVVPLIRVLGARLDARWGEQ